MSALGGGKILNDGVADVSETCIRRSFAETCSAKIMCKESPSIADIKM
jgi:hypothetical protein